MERIQYIYLNIPTVAPTVDPIAAPPSRPFGSLIRLRSRVGIIRDPNVPPITAKSVICNKLR